MNFSISSHWQTPHAPLPERYARSRLRSKRRVWFTGCFEAQIRSVLRLRSP